MSKAKRISVGALAAIFLILSVVMIWGNSSDWGKTDMQRTIFTYSTHGNLYTGSGILMAPKSASSDNQVPGVVVFGGASSYSYALKSYGIELARRGYAVLLCDMPGQGMSTMVGHDGGYQNYKGTEGTAEATSEDATAYTDAAAEYLQSLNFVDSDNLIVAGFSAGQSWALQCAVRNPDMFRAIVTISGYNIQYAATAKEAGQNFVAIKADENAQRPEFDLVKGQFTGEGSFDDGTAEYVYWNQKAVQHQMQPITGSLIAAFEEACEMISPTGSTLAYSDQIYMGSEIWGALAVISLFVLVGVILNALLSMEFFKSLHREPAPVYVNLSEADTDPRKRILKSTLFMTFRILVVIILYELLAARTQIIPLFSGTRWAGLWLNIWVPFLVGNMIVNVIIFLIWHRKIGKPAGGNAYNYAMTWGKAKDTAINILKCILLGFIVVFFVLAFLAFLDTLLAINIKVMIFGLITFNLEHMLQMPTYILLYFALLLCASLTQYISNPNFEDGTKKMSWIFSIRTTLLAIMPYLVLCVWNTLKGMEKITMAGTYTVDHFAPLDNLYGYPIMMALITPIMDMLYRKTKSVWPGVIVCSMILGVLIASNYSLNQTWFG